MTATEPCWVCGRSKTDHNEYCLFYTEEQVSVYKELREENQKLKKRIEELEEEVAALESELEERPAAPVYDWRELD